MSYPNISTLNINLNLGYPITFNALPNLQPPTTPAGSNIPTGSSPAASWGNVDNIGTPSLPLAMPCDSNGWRHLYGTRSPGRQATLLYVQAYSAYDSTLGHGSNYIKGIGSPLSASDAWNALKSSPFSGDSSILDRADDWVIHRRGHTQGAPLDHGGGGHAHSAIGQAVAHCFNDEIARSLLQENHPMVWMNGDGTVGTEGPFGVGLERPTHEYPNQELNGHRFGPFFVDNTMSTTRVDNGVSHWNAVQQVIYATRGEGTATPRNFIGLIRCTEDHDHGSPEVSTFFIQDIPDTSVIVPVNADATARGGYNPELIFYGGDVHGVQGYANVNSSGTITDITITDPGGSVVAVEKEEKNIIPPEVLLSTPNDSTLFEGFYANVEISTSPEDIQAAYEHLDLAVTNEELNAFFAAQHGHTLAQSFLITDNETVGQGIFVSSVDICFFSKPSEFSSATKEPVIVQLRPCTNSGLPSRDLVMDCFGRPAEATMQWDDIIPRNGTHIDQGGNGFPDFDNNFTKFTFPVPVFLQPDTYYAIVVMSNDSAYQIWINDIKNQLLVDGERAGTLAEGGQTTSESGRVNHGGSLFKSQNGFTWSEDQNQDMMFRINRCSFKNNSDHGGGPGTVDVHLGNDLASNFDYDRLDLNLNPGFGTLIPNLDVTQISKTYHTKNTVGTEQQHYDFVENVVMNMPERKRLSSGQAHGDFKVSCSLTTTDKTISPVIDISQWQLIAYKNFINNGGFQNGDLSANNLINFAPDGTGTGFSQNDLIAVSGGGGSGAELIVESVGAGGKITSLGFNNVGSGYYKKATVNTGSHTVGSEASIGAVITLDGEEGPGGGNAKFRYITKAVNLAKGMDATGLKVFLTARRPEGTKIYVYYKVRSNLDSSPGVLEDKNWTVMRQILPDTDYGSESFMEFEFDTGGDDIVYDSVDSDGNRSTYDSFNIFKMKIVAHAENSWSVPVIKDFRAIAVT